MRKIILVAAIAAMVSGAAYAGMPAGSMGFGFVDSDAPIGIRYMMSETMGFDVGVGFASYDGGNTIIRLNAGVPFTLIEHGRCWLDIRPAFSLENISPDVGDSYMNFAIHGWLVANVLLTDNFGIHAASGVSVEMPDNNDDRLTNIVDRGFNATEIGWFFWF